MDDPSTAPARGLGGPAPLRRTLLVMVDDRVEVHPLPLTGVLTIGRGSTADLPIDHPSISRAHLRLALDERELRVTDLGGSNGTFLRGARLPSGTDVRITPNEALQTGDVVIVVQQLVAPRSGSGPAPNRPSGSIAAGTLPPLVLDPAMKQVYELAARVARGTINILLVGETGAGKEVLAEHIHARSPRAGGPLVRINCAALTDTLADAELFGHERGAFTGAQRERPGLIESADRGTLLLDEVGELTPSVQAKLLRVIEDGMLLRVGSSAPQPIDVRFIAATNRDLEAEADAGRFRRDLYFRLAGVVLTIPPLRERPLEVAVLAERFAADAARPLGRPAPRLAASALAALRDHAWPGNVRELKNLMQREVLVSETPELEADALGLEPRSSQPVLDDELEAIERRRILDALERCHGNQTRAAAEVGMPLRTFIKRLDRYAVPRPRKR